MLLRCPICGTLREATLGATCTPCFVTRTAIVRLVEARRVGISTDDIPKELRDTDRLMREKPSGR